MFGGIGCKFTLELGLETASANFASLRFSDICGE